MRATVAKKLRRLVYGDFSPRQRYYERASPKTRTLRSVGTRRRYRQLKAAYRAGDRSMLKK